MELVFYNIRRIKEKMNLFTIIHTNYHKNLHPYSNKKTFHIVLYYQFITIPNSTTNIPVIASKPLLFLN